MKNNVHYVNYLNDGLQLEKYLCLKQHLFNINAQQNGGSIPTPNKLPSHHQTHHTNTAHANHHPTNSHHPDRSSQQLAVNVVKKRRSGKNKIVTLLMKNAEGEYECVRS
jgi:hypothetical protein